MTGFSDRVVSGTSFVLASTVGMLCNGMTTQGVPTSVTMMTILGVLVSVVNGDIDAPKTALHPCSIA